MSSSGVSTETTAIASASSASSIALAVLPGRRGADPYRVVMVCIGNIYRFVMAEVVLCDRLAAIGIPDFGPDGVTVTFAGVSDEECDNSIDSRVRRASTGAGYGVGADDVSRATDSTITSHVAHRVIGAEIIKADLLLTMADPHRNVLQRRAAGLGAEPDYIRMYRKPDPAFAPQAEAVATGGSSRSILNVPDPWYGTMVDFLDTFEVVRWVGNELAEQLTVPHD